jgi:hypothetical protein
MAVLTANYVKKGSTERDRAKATIRYIEHRPGKDHEKMARNLFGIDGFIGRWQAYRMVDEAEKGRYFYRFVINPDPVNEDREKDLPLREIIDYTMQTLEERTKRPVQWVAAVHDDHTDKRHIHALAVVKGRLKKDDLQALIQAATEEAELQRHARDLMREVAQVQREREDAAWALEPELEEAAWAR